MSGRYITSLISFALTRFFGETKSYGLYGSSSSKIGPLQRAKYAVEINLFPPFSGPQSKPWVFLICFSEKSKISPGLNVLSREL